MQNRSRFLIAALLPLFILILMTMIPLRTYLSGQEILLETIPVDPSDVFRGDHVILDYKISQVSGDLVPRELKDDSSEYRYFGKKMYARLKPAGNYYEVAEILLDKPKNGLYLPCTYEYRDKNTSVAGTMYFKFNFYLDRFFVPDNTGTLFEDLSRQGELVAKVRVYDGYALVTDVFAKP